MHKFSTRLKSMGFLVRFYFLSCTKNIENLRLNEQAIYLSGRFASDIPKDRYRKPLEILDFSEISPGQTVVDLLGGGGYYSELFSHIVGDEGTVYLQNNSLFLRFSEKELTERLADHRLTNVVRLDSEYADMKLPTNVDVLFLGLSFHDFFVKRNDPVITAIPEEFYHQIKTSLKPNGLIIIIDHSARSGIRLTDTSRLHRIDADWVKKSLQSNGFEFIDSLEILNNPKDNLELKIWNESVFHQTDQFIHKYRRISEGIR